MRAFVGVLAATLASLALVACGGSSEDTTAGNPQRSDEAILFEADPRGGLAYTTDTLVAEPGEAEIEFVNSSPASHDVAIEDAGGKTIAQTKTVTEGSDSTKVELQPGTYVFYCTLPGHRLGGMEGTLKVK